MEREGVLAVGVAAVLLAVALVVVAVPGVVADAPAPDREPPGQLAIAGVDIAPGEAAGRTVTLRVDALLSHRGGPSENVTVAFRAVDLESGLLETSRRVAVPTVTDEREVPVRANLSVEREGGYRVETVVYSDGRRVAEGSREVRGVGSLAPDYATTPVGFHRFDGLAADMPVVEYGIREAAGNRTTLDVSAYLTNAGNADAGGLEVVFTARQADSGIVADRATVAVDGVRPGRTVTPSADLTVPAGYNYYLDAVLWNDGVVVDTARSAARLNPSESLSVNVTRDDEGLQVDEFETGDAPGSGPQPDGPEREATESAGQPGFGVGVAVAALVGAALLARRKPQ